MSKELKNIKMETMVYFAQDRDEDIGYRLSFMADDVLGVASDVYKSKSYDMLQLLILENTKGDLIQLYDGIFDGIRQLADRLSKISYVGIRLGNKNINDKLIKDLEAIGFEDINFYCGFDNSVPFLYIGEESAKGIYNKMKEVTKRLDD